MSSASHLAKWNWLTRFVGISRWRLQVERDSFPLKDCEKRIRPGRDRIS